MSLSTFTLFARLPTELRLKIWHHAIPEGVCIELSAKKSTEAEKNCDLARCSDYAVPPLLHVNSEARAVALPHYRILGVGLSRVYFNPTVDAVLLSGLFSSRIDYYAAAKDPCGLLGPDVSLIRHIVYHQPFDIGWAMNPRFLHMFRGAETFTFLDMEEWLSAFYPSWREAREAMRPKVFRKEQLVFQDDERETRNPWCQMAKETLQRKGNVVRDVKTAVVKLNMPPAIKEERMRVKEEEKRIEKEEEERERKGGYWGYFTRYLVSAGVLDRLRIPVKGQDLIEKEAKERRMRGGPWDYVTRALVRVGVVDANRIPSQSRELIGK